MHPAPTTAQGWELPVTNPFNPRATGTANTHAHTHLLYYNLSHNTEKKNVLHQKCNYHIFNRCMHAVAGNTWFAMLNLNQVLGLGATAPKWSALILWHITPCRLTFLQSQSVNACFYLNNDCQIDYSSNWSIFFITNALFYLTRISCRIIDIYVIFRATAFCCLTSVHTACASWLCTCVFSCMLEHWAVLLY